MDACPCPVCGRPFDETSLDIMFRLDDGRYHEAHYTCECKIEFRTQRNWRFPESKIRMTEEFIKEWNKLYVL